MTKNINDVVALLCKAAENEQKENYPAAFIQYKQAMMISTSSEHRNLLHTALRRVGDKMTSRTRRLEDESIELNLRYNDKRIRWRFDTRQLLQQLCDVALPAVESDTPVLLLDLTQGFASDRLVEQGADVLSLVPHSIVERHLLFEYPVQKREQFRDFLYTQKNSSCWTKSNLILIILSMIMQWP